MDKGKPSSLLLPQKKKRVFSLNHSWWVICLLPISLSAWFPLACYHVSKALSSVFLVLNCTFQSVPNPNFIQFISLALIIRNSICKVLRFFFFFLGQKKIVSKKKASFEKKVKRKRKFENPEVWSVSIAQVIEWLLWPHRPWSNIRKKGENLLWSRCLKKSMDKNQWFSDITTKESISN